MQFQIKKLVPELCFPFLGNNIDPVFHVWSKCNLHPRINFTNHTFKKAGLFLSKFILRKKIIPAFGYFSMKKTI